mmetsp:Transcript_18020/g.29596  ORF Transcript_18020/g.29596 Transcript_18020/m.29596 type:complete len:897 (-) Transcript_18020:327-3017(-)
MGKPRAGLRAVGGSTNAKGKKKKGDESSHVVTHKKKGEDAATQPIIPRAVSTSSPRGPPEKTGGSSAGVKGLVNLGNTCFFNAVMQNVVCTGPLVEMLLGEGMPDAARDEFLVKGKKQAEEQQGQGQGETPGAGRLTSSLRKFLLAMWQPNGSNVNPRELFSEVCHKAPRFQGYQQQDSHELLRYLMDSLRSETNGSNAAASGSPSKSKTRRTADKPSKIDEIFGGVLRSCIQCSECGRVTDVFEPFLDLSIPIPSVSFTPALNESQVVPLGQAKTEDFQALPATSSKQSRREFQKDKKRQRQAQNRVQRNKGPPGTVKDSPTEGGGGSGEKLQSHDGKPEDSENQTPAEDTSAAYVIDDVKGPSEKETEVVRNRDSDNSSSSSRSGSTGEEVDMDQGDIHASITGMGLDVVSWLGGLQIVDSRTTSPIPIIPSQASPSSSVRPTSPTSERSDPSLPSTPTTRGRSSSLSDRQSPTDFSFMFPEPSFPASIPSVLPEYQSRHHSPCSSPHSQDHEPFSTEDNPVHSDVPHPILPKHIEGTGICTSSLPQDNPSTQHMNTRSISPSTQQPLELPSDSVRLPSTAIPADESQRALSQPIEDMPSTFLGLPNDSTITDASLQPPIPAESSHDTRSPIHSTSSPSTDTTSLGASAGMKGAKKDDDRVHIEVPLVIPVARSMENCFKLFSGPEVLEGDNAVECDECSKRAAQLVGRSAANQKAPALNSRSTCDTQDEGSNGGKEDGEDHSNVGTPDAVPRVKRRALKQYSIHRAPPILTIHLMRFQRNSKGRLQKLAGHVSFPSILDLFPFSCNSLGTPCPGPSLCPGHAEHTASHSKKDELQYRLYGVVVHGGGLGGGHYTAYVLHKEQWYYFSDTHLSRRSEAEVLAAEAYILFYQRIS